MAQTSNEGQHLTLGLQRVGGRDVEGNRKPDLGTETRGQTLNIDPVVDDQAPHETDPGWYSMHRSWDKVGYHARAGQTDANAVNASGYAPTPPGRQNIAGVTDGSTPTVGTLFGGRPGDADNILD